MTKYRICFSLLTGFGLTALVCLLLNIPVANFLLSVLLIPGGIASSILPWNASWVSISILLSANVLIYSIAVLVVLVLPFRATALVTLKKATLRMALPVAVVSCLACFPSLNPLWPRGMAELSRQESELQKALPLNMALRDARSLLNAKGIPSAEFVEDSEGVVFQGPDAKISVRPGDRVLSGLSERSASSFPCTYKMQVILAFGPDEKLRERYIGRAPICP